MSDTLGELQRLLRERMAHAPALTPETELVADLALDSIQQLDLIVELENHFAVSLELDEDEDISTLGQLAAWIDRMRVVEAARG